MTMEFVSTGLAFGSNDGIPLAAAPVDPRLPERHARSQDGLTGGDARPPLSAVTETRLKKDLK